MVVSIAVSRIGSEMGLRERLRERMVILDENESAVSKGSRREGVQCCDHVGIVYPPPFLDRPDSVFVCKSVAL